MTGTLMARNDVVAFLGLPGANDGDPLIFTRMKGFTSGTQNKNPKEYTRQYIDEDFEQTSVVGYTSTIDFACDVYVGNEVHAYIKELSDNETLGSGAVVSILMYNATVAPPDNNAWVRPYSCIVSTEGDSLDAYTLKGTFKAAGGREFGTAVLSNDGLIADWTPAAGV